MSTTHTSKRFLSGLLSVLILLSVFSVGLIASIQNAQARQGDIVIGETTFESTLFDYYYDSEMVGSDILQGVAQSYTNEAYHMLNNAASDYYESYGVKYPVYFGNFYKQDVNAKFDYTQLPQELYNFTWTANISNRTNYNAVVQGVYADNLIDGVPAQMTNNGSAVKVPFFDPSWIVNTTAQQAMIVNFSLNYGDTHMTMPYTDGDSTGANTFRLYEVITPGTNYYFCERNSDCNTLADNLYGTPDKDKIGIHFIFETWDDMPDAMSANILTPSGSMMKVPLTLDAHNRTYWAVLDIDDYPQLTGPAKNIQMGEVYENLNFPFDIIDNNGVTYFQFSTREYNHDINNNMQDSSGKPSGVTTGQNNVYFNGEDWAIRNTGVRDWNFEDQDSIPDEWSQDNDMGDGFFPLNPFDPDPSSEGNYDYTSKRDLKYGYAVKYEIPFTLSSDGFVLDADGNKTPMSFEFMGDDDLLVYIDDELVLDMGGAHKMAKGKIDFSKGEATVTTGAITNISANASSIDPLSAKSSSTAGYTAGNVTTSKGILKEFKDAGNTYDPTELHTMTIFYVERGMFNANAFIRFNMPVTTSVQVEKKAEYSNLEDTDIAEYQDDEFYYDFTLNTINGSSIDEYTTSLWNSITVKKNGEEAKVINARYAIGNTFTFSLKAGDVAEFSNIPSNIGYTITEHKAEGYSLESISAKNLLNADSKETVLDTEVVSCVTNEREALKFTFLNSADPIPTTAPPTTVAPTTVAPTTVAPTTVAPTTVPPTTIAPTTVAPTTVPPTTIAPTTVAPTTVAPTTVPPTTVAPTTAAPIMTDPTEPPTTVAPTTAAPTTVAPTTAAPTTAAPIMTDPTEPPTTVAPATVAPTTVAPTTVEPTTTVAPTTAEPTTTVVTVPVTTLPAPTEQTNAVDTQPEAPADIVDTGENIITLIVFSIVLSAGVVCIIFKKRIDKVSE